MSTEIPSNHRILVVDDNEAIHKDFRKILCTRTKCESLASIESSLFGTSDTPTSARPVMQVDSAMQGEEGYAMVRKAKEEGKPYAVAFIDMRMPPGWDGLRTIREIWRADPDVNVVICTAFSDQSWSDIEETAGDGDRLLVLKKPFEPIEVRQLAAALTAKWTQNARSKMKMSELEVLYGKRNLELQHAALHDRLTDLPNRALFNDRLARAMELGRRKPEMRAAVLFIDFDRFKWVNDSLGHEAGDLLLKAISQRLLHTLRGTDSLAACGQDDSLTARLGGDEFCVLLTGLKKDEDAALVANRILHELARPYEILGHHVHSTASIGIAVSAPHYQRAEDMIRDADTAMYRAKADGKGRFVMFDTTMHDQAVRRLTISNELHRAVAQKELLVHFQPIVRLDTGELTGAEALVRWNHPQRGMIPPADFIEIAEESGFIDVLGQYVLEASCRQLQDWKARLPDLNLSISVNVSTKQLATDDFCVKLDAVLAATGIDPKSLILEITETALVEATELTGSNLLCIRAKGIRVYLDDFGTGYSSLTALNKFRLDGLKIDRSFVKAAGGVRQLAAIIQAVTDLAKNLSMEVVAEGVETPEQLLLLQSLHCEKAQGFLFSPAVAAADFEVFLRDRSIILAKTRIAAA